MIKIPLFFAAVNELFPDRINTLYIYIYETEMIPELQKPGVKRACRYDYYIFIQMRTLKFHFVTGPRMHQE
jgi:hypothetical protein